MTILSDKAIRKFVRNNRIGIEPEPAGEQFQPASLDVRIGSEIYNPELDQYYDCDDEITLMPGKRILGTTQERIELPIDLAAQLAGRSSVGRDGVIVHKTAGWIDPGFRGQITLELYNFCDEPYVLDVGERVAQLVFFQLDQPSSGYDGHYQDQDGVEESYDR